MKPPQIVTSFRPLFIAAIASGLLLCGRLIAEPPAEAERPSGDKAAAEDASTNAPEAAVKADAPAADTNAPPLAADSDKSLTSTNKVQKPKRVAAKTVSGTSTNSASSTNEIQVSFQGANVDMIVQWLAQNTGKSVVKHPQVQCQLNITSSKKVTLREAVNLIYRALSLEGFTAIETEDSILIVPEGKEPKLNPMILDGARKDIPQGRQRLVKIFPLAHIQAADLREKLRPLLSDKGSIDIDERANQLVVTDYNDNLRLLNELITDFDVPASGLVVEIYPLKYADAEELGSLISLIVNAQPGGTGGKSSSSRRGSGPSGSGPMSFGGPPPSGDSGDGGGGSPQPGGSGASGPTQQVRIWPDKTSNRLIVFAPKSKLAEVQRLVDVLDTEKPEDVAVRTIPLKNVNAVDLVKEIGPLYQKMSGRSPKEMVEITANDRSNSLIVLSSEANFKAVSKLVSTLDTEDALDKVVRTFPLKNADAEDVAKQLQDLNKDSDNSSSPYRYFFFNSGGNKPANRKMSVVSDRRRNSLVIQAPPAQMETIEKMIADLDEPVTDDSLAPKIYPLKYVSASDIEDVLNELFLKKTQQRNYWDYYFSDSQQDNTDHDVGRLYGKVRITSEPYANAIIVTSNSKESLAVIEDVLKQLDQPSEANESTLRIGLRFAKAFTVANSINILFAKNGAPPIRPPNQQPQQNPNQSQNQQANAGSTSVTQGFEMEKENKEEGYYPWVGGPPDNPRSGDSRSAVRPVSDLVGRVRAVADERSNSLLISANVHFFPQILKLIQELDAQTDQVLIEARIVEVSSDYLDKLGVRWSPDGSKVLTTDDYDNSFLAHAAGDYQRGFGDKTAINSPPISASSLAQTLVSLRSGVIGSTFNMDFLIQFLRRTTDARVMAEPQINIRDNESGRLFVGQQVPTLSQNYNQGSIGQNQNYVYRNVGVILEVTPHINKEGNVELRIHAESSILDPTLTILGGPVIDTRYFHTDLTAKDGETLVLGGIIQKQLNNTIRKFPLLGDIPGLGWLFKKKDQETREVELMVFLRPRVTKTPKDSRDLLEDLYRKFPKVRESQDPVTPQNGGKKGKASSNS